MVTKVLYIEDEPYLSRIVSDTLTLKGYKILHKKDGTRISEALKQFEPDICILDVMLPHIDGYTLGNIIRNAHPQLPIIFLTAKGQPQDIIQGFAAGGTDYMRKPFSIDELTARIENQLRLLQLRNEKIQELPDAIEIKNWLYYPKKLELHSGDTIKRLSQREAQVLNLLCLYKGKELDRRLLLKAVWGDDSFFNSRNLDVYIRKLRALFATNPEIQIITLKGQGYLFSC
jgi:DNA-binding response OmpR family regulator